MNGEIILSVALSIVLSSSGEQPEVVTNRQTGCTAEIYASGRRVIRCPKPLSLSLAEARQPFVDELLRSSATHAKACGLIGVGDAPEAAVACAVKAQEDRVPFWVAFQTPGFDSELWTGATLLPDGSLAILNYDSNRQGQPDIDPHFSRVICSALRFDLDHVAVIACAR